MEYFDPVARPWKKFTVPSEVSLKKLPLPLRVILTTSYQLLDTLQNASRAPPLLQLPTEILIAIFEEVSYLDQLALAVSSKHLLHVSTLVTLKTNKFAGNPLSPWRMQAILIRLLSPTTTAWKICSACSLYRPTRKKYWKAKADLHGWDLGKAGKEVPMTERISGWKHNKTDTVCPDCIWGRRTFIGWSQKKTSYNRSLPKRLYHSTCQKVTDIGKAIRDYSWR